MTRNFYTLFLFVFCFSFTALAYSNNKSENSKKDNFDVNGVIMHHVKDSHDFHILDWNGHPVSVPLPVILWTNEGLVIFMSSEFHHDDSGETVVKRKKQGFVKFHEEIYYAGNDVDCIIRLSSGLIDILENKEIEFVIGHEIGHFIYGHGLALSSSDSESLEFSIQKIRHYFLCYLE